MLGICQWQFLKNYSEFVWKARHVPRSFSNHCPVPILLLQKNGFRYFHPLYFSSITNLSPKRRILLLLTAERKSLSCWLWKLQNLRPPGRLESFAHMPCILWPLFRLFFQRVLLIPAMLQLHTVLSIVLAAPLSMQRKTQQNLVIRTRLSLPFIKTPEALQSHSTHASLSSLTLQIRQLNLPSHNAMKKSQSRKSPHFSTPLLGDCSDH